MKQTKTKKEQKYVDEMRKIVKDHNHDPELAHILADDLLLEIIREELGFHLLADLYEDVEKWYA